jgi:Zn finger protein HypA/HybF involved in hydrogenase expression
MSRRVRFTEDEARAAIAGARSFSDALRRLGLRPAGGNHATLRKYAARWSISTDHFDPAAIRREALSRANSAIPLADVLVRGSTYSRANLKRRLLETGLKKAACEMCGQGESWRGSRLALILDHINGVHDDNRFENLRILCPNCAATLATHCGRKNVVAVDGRDCLHCGRTFMPKTHRQRYCSAGCGSRYARDGAARPDARKVVRPSYEQLLREISESSFLAVGRRYGVSDNAIRKWVRQYEREAEASGGEPQAA